MTNLLRINVMIKSYERQSNKLEIVGGAVCVPYSECGKNVGNSNTIQYIFIKLVTAKNKRI